MTNRWNLRIYRIWSLWYDALLGRLFAPGRRQAVALLGAGPGQRLLLPGVGTGADLPLLPPGSCAVGIDLSPAMLARARARLPLSGRTVLLVRGDAAALPLRDAACDAGLLSLIVSVAPDGAACLREAARVVAPGGRIVLFDKFLPDTARPGPLRRALNWLTRRLGTDINRRLADVLAGGAYSVDGDRPSILRGVYRTVVVISRTHQNRSAA